MKNKLGLITILITLKLMFDYIYIYYISELWGYTGFYSDINLNKYLVSFFIYFLISCIMFLINSDYISNIILLLLFITVYLPINSYYALTNQSSYFFLVVSMIFIFITISILFLNRLRNDNYSTTLYLPLTIKVILFSIILYSFVVMMIFNISNFNITLLIDWINVYEARENIVYAFGTGYTFNWTTKVLVPFFLAYYFLSKKYKIVFFLSLIQVSLYLVTGHKLVLFILLITFLILLMYRETYNLMKWILLAFVSIFGIAVFEVLFLTRSFVVDFFLRRVMYLPAMITNYYYEYTLINGYQYYSDSIFYRILFSEDELNVSYIIGQEYFGSSNTNAVAGFFATEYLNLGILGLLIGAIIIILYLKMLDYVTINQKITICTIFSSVYTLWNTALLTAMLTGGIALTAIVLYLLYYYSRE